MSSGNIYGDAGSFNPPATATHYDLRPLSTGEVLDRTFQIYRSRFALFAGLALLPAAVNIAANAARLLYTAHEQNHVHLAGASLYKLQAVTGTLATISWIISMVLYGITEAATTWAVSAVYLGEAASIRVAYGVALEHWFRYTLIRLRQVWALMWMPLVFVTGAVILLVMSRHGRGHFLWETGLLFGLAFLALIYGVWAYLRVSLSVPASVVESLTVGASLRRSSQLLVSRKIRIFLLLLLMAALYMVVGVIESPLLILLVRSRGTEAFVTQAINLGVGFVAGTLIWPVGAIAVCLFYFDERVRREGFDIEWMMRKLAPMQPGGAQIAPPPPQENSAEPA